MIWYYLWFQLSWNIFSQVSGDDHIQSYKYVMNGVYSGLQGPPYPSIFFFKMFLAILKFQMSFIVILQSTIPPKSCEYFDLKKWKLVTSVRFSHSVVSNSLRTRIVAHQASLSITNSRSSLRLTSIESVMLSSHLILCRPLLLLPLVPPSIRVFSNESTLRRRWPKYWSFSFSIILPKNTQGWSPSEWTGWISLQSKGLSRVFLDPI